MAASKPMNVYGARLSRRQFVKSGGALIVGVRLIGSDLLQTGAAAAEVIGGKNTPDPAKVSSWFEIHADNTMVLHTGSCDFGQSSATTAFKQIVADELNFPYESITSVVMGDTDRTPDGSVSAGFLHRGGQNLRKAAAYTQQALLDLAAAKLGVDKKQLTAKDGVISGGGKRVSYGQLVSGQQLTLTIPVTGELTAMQGLRVAGDPPMKPPSQYTVIGKSYPNYVTVSKVSAKETWVTDVRLPGMLHGRVVHPKTLGSTLVSAGDVDKKRFPNAQVIVTGNLVGVVAPTEWEAAGAAQQVATATKWTEWKGLPGHANLAAWMRERSHWTAPVSKGSRNRGDAAAALTGATKKLSAAYDLPFMKHGPIGPTVAVADTRPDGTVFVYTHTQNPSYLRGQIAMMLQTPIENVVIRTYAGPGHYGRSNGGNAGGEDEAVLLSKAVGKPVRVQWSRPDDVMWSTNSPPGYAEVQMALDAQGNIVAAQFDHYMPVMQDDRPIGAVLAGLPTMKAPDVEGNPGGLGSIVNYVSDPWLYNKVPNLAEFGHGSYQIGQKESPLEIGLRDHSMRTPGQLQQNFPHELAMSEAAAMAGIDAIEFRLRHTSDERLIAVLKAVREESGWQTRRSPNAQAVAAGSQFVVSGQGVSVMLRGNTYWACVCQISISTQTGKMTVDKYSIAAEPGIVINPAQFKRQIQGGAMMGIGHTLYEELQFDESGVTSRDWRTYPIATIADVPEMNVVIIARPDLGTYGDGSEAANALALPAIAAAFFDATGKVVRRLPLRPEYVLRVLKG
jgi:CO/xanthine dehydrogenase Mo-binding subunit